MRFHRLYLVIILLASLATRFAFFGLPDETVFDEVHFGKFISGYFTGEYFFDIHPPLGKLMYALVGRLNGFKPGFSFENIGLAYPDDTFIWLRLLPTLFGVFLPIIIFLIARQLDISEKFSLFAGLMVVFDNALLVQSRFILLDTFLLVFGFLAILFYLKSRISRRTIHYIYAGIFCALAILIKWTGLGFLGLVGLFYLLEKNVSLARKILRGTFYFVALPLAIYYAVFALHFSLLYKTGSGDAFHTPEFQKTLIASGFENDPAISAANMFKKFIELNKVMFSANAGLEASHPYASKWYTWPIMLRGVYYWNKDLRDDVHQRIYLLGNPFIWWGGFFAVILTLWWFWDNRTKIIRQFEEHRMLIFLLGGFMANTIPHAFISRVLFLYHYFPALIFSILLFAYWLDKWKFNLRIFTVLLAGLILLFFVFAPISYGLTISQRHFDLVMWFEGWR